MSAWVTCQMLIIDGSYGEGGGQILRSALTLSAITGTPVHIEEIRARRSTPGLRPQHLTAVWAAAKICRASVSGDHLGSQSLVFEPTMPPVPGDYCFDVTDAASGGSAGAVTLILQTVLLPLALADGVSMVTLRGGTTVRWSPSALYITQVYLPVLARMGVKTAVHAHHWGFYPRGGGELTVEIMGGAALSAPDFSQRGRLLEVQGTAYVSRLPSHIPQRMSDRTASLLRKQHLPVHITPQHVAADDPAAGIFLLARYENALAGFSSLGRKGLPSEIVAEQACEALLCYHKSGAAVDPYLGDQLVLPLVLAGDKVCVSVFKVTHHLLTNLWAVSHFAMTPARVDGKEGEPGLLIVGEELCYD